MNWLETAKNLQTGHNTRHDCPQCGLGTNTNAAIVNHNLKYYSIFCHACDFKDYETKGVMTLEERKRIQEIDNDAIRQSQNRTITIPADTTYNPTDFSREARQWLFKGGLSPTVWKQFQIGYSPRLKRVVLPVYFEGKLVWYQLRAVNKHQRPKYVQPSADKSRIIFSTSRWLTTRRVIIVEDIMSAIRVGNATDERTVATSILGTKISAGQANIISEADEVVIWLDGDRAGREGAISIKRTLGLLTTVRQVRTELDPKEYSNKQIQEVLA